MILESENGATLFPGWNTELQYRFLIVGSDDDSQIQNISQQ